jgi:nucleoside phosphorylase
MSLLYIFAATGMEAQPVRRIGVASDSSATLRCGQNELVLNISGMGPAKAGRKAEIAFNAARVSPSSPKPNAAVVVGLCGGLTASLPEGRIVAYTACRSVEDHKPLLRCSDTIVDSVIEILKSSGIVCDRVVGITSSRFATMPDQRAGLAQQYGAAVVDMETYLILETAAADGVSAVVLRVISDSFYRKLPDFNRALNADGSLDGWKALRVALGSPVKTARLIVANKRAMQSLSKALEIVLKAPCFV